MFIKSRLAFVGALVAVFVLAPAAEASTPGDSVRIVTQIDFSSFPIHGTFDVAEGAGALGCAGGTFVDRQMAQAPSFSTNLKTLSCTEGPAAGSVFMIIFKATLRPGPGDLNGPWTFFKGTGALANVRGGGDFWIAFLSDTAGTETFAGVVKSA